MSCKRNLLFSLKSFRKTLIRTTKGQIVYLVRPKLLDRKEKDERESSENLQGGISSVRTAIAPLWLELVDINSYVAVE